MPTGPRIVQYPGEGTLAIYDEEVDWPSHIPLALRGLRAINAGWKPTLGLSQAVDTAWLWYCIATREMETLSIPAPHQTYMSFIEPIPLRVSRDAFLGRRIHDTR